MVLFRDNETNKATRLNKVKTPIWPKKEANQWALIYKRGCRF